MTGSVIDDPLNVGEIFVGLLKDAHIFLAHAATVQDKLDAFIAKLAPGFKDWLPGGDSMEGFYPPHFEKFLYEKTYTNIAYEMVTARVDTEGNLTFEVLG